MKREMNDVIARLTASSFQGSLTQKKLEKIKNRRPNAELELKERIYTHVYIHSQIYIYKNEKPRKLYKVSLIGKGNALAMVFA